MVMRNPWATEEEDALDLTKLEYGTKVFIILEESDKEQWGVVKDNTDMLFTALKECPAIGTWSRAPYDNLIHIALTTPIKALLDRAVQLTALRVKEREQGFEMLKAGKKTRTTRKQTTKELEPTPELSAENKALFSGLRARIGK